MSRYYCGIDPGYKTGVALVNGDWAEVHDSQWSESVNTLELSHILNSVPVDFVIVRSRVPDRCRASVPPNWASATVRFWAPCRFSIKYAR